MSGMGMSSDRDGMRLVPAALPTAGAVPVRNKRGEITMQKVKVTRYVAGQRPVFVDDDGDSDSERRSAAPFERPDALPRQSRSAGAAASSSSAPSSDAASSDPRWRRLQQLKAEREAVVDGDADDERSSRRRPTREAEAEVLTKADRRRRASSSSSEGEEGRRACTSAPRRPRSPANDDVDAEADVPDEEFEKRRELLRQRARLRQKEEELLARQQEDEEPPSEEESSEYEEYTDSEDDAAPRLKPVFVRKRDRITLQETEKERQRLKELQLEQKRNEEARKRASAKLVEDLVKREIELESRQKEDRLDLDSVCTDDENEELAYEQWKIRELKRVKRDKEERDALAREKAEWDRVHNMTEEERRAYARANPRVVTNKQERGKYKFLQKYYHRGAFFLDEDDGVYKRNFAEPTLEDHFDKSILPKVMQVKDFGKAGRTKWTHLTAEDTTDFQSAWVDDSAQNLKFFNKHAAGIKDVFERPAAKKRKKPES